MFKELPLKEIQLPENFNCRGDVYESDVYQLAGAIEKQGLLQPLVVRVVNDPATGRDTYTLIAGFRRYAALSYLKRETAPANIVSCSDEEAAFINLSENVDRENLTPKQEAQACRKLAERFNFSFRQIAARLKRSEAWVQTRLEIAAMPEEVQCLIGQKVPLGKVHQLYRAHNAGVLDTVIKKMLKSAVVKLEKNKPTDSPKHRTKNEILLQMGAIADSTKRDYTREEVLSVLAWCAGNCSWSITL